MIVERLSGGKPSRDHGLNSPEFGNSDTERVPSPSSESFIKNDVRAPLHHETCPPPPHPQDTPGGDKWPPSALRDRAMRIRRLRHGKRSELTTGVYNIVL